MTRYDVTVQWADLTKENGYQQELASAVVEAASPEEALEAGRSLRPNVSRVQVHGVAGTGVAFQGAAFAWATDSVNRRT